MSSAKMASFLSVGRRVRSLYTRYGQGHFSLRSTSAWTDRNLRSTRRLFWSSITAHFYQVWFVLTSHRNYDDPIELYALEISSWKPFSLRNRHVYFGYLGARHHGCLNRNVRYGSQSTHRESGNKVLVTKIWLTCFCQYPGSAVQGLITMLNSAYLD